MFFLVFVILLGAQEDDENWKRVQTAVDRLDRAVDEGSKSSAAREEGVWTKLNSELGALRQQIEQEHVARERDDEEKMRMINEVPCCFVL